MSQKIPDELAAQLVESGMSGQQVADYLRHHRGIKVTRQAISLWRKRNGYPVRPMVHDWSPWDVPFDHRMLEPYRVIRWHERRRRGLPLGEDDERRLDAALDMLGADLVFDYRPELEDSAGTPWVVVRRRPEDGDGIVRRHAEA